jgi:hypothetical protein
MIESVTTNRQQKHGGKLYMRETKYAGVMACLLLAGGVAACSSTDASKSPITPLAAQTKTATKPAPAICQAQSQTSLDALRRGDSAKTPVDSALKEIFLPLLKTEWPT